jgi:hypothetical protein
MVGIETVLLRQNPTITLAGFGMLVTYMHVAVHQPCGLNLQIANRKRNHKGNGVTHAAAESTHHHSTMGSYLTFEFLPWNCRFSIRWHSFFACTSHFVVCSPSVAVCHLIASRDLGGQRGVVLRFPGQILGLADSSICIRVGQTSPFGTRNSLRQRFKLVSHVCSNQKLIIDCAESLLYFLSVQNTHSDGKNSEIVICTCAKTFFVPLFVAASRGNLRCRQTIKITNFLSFRLPGVS